MKLSIKKNKWENWNPEKCEKIAINTLIYLTLMTFFLIISFPLGYWILAIGEYFWLITMIISYTKWHKEREENLRLANQYMEDDFREAHPNEFSRLKTKE